MHENHWKEGELDKLKKYLPKKKSNVGRPPSIGTKDLELRFTFPYLIDYLSDELKSELMGLAMEIGVIFFFRHFTYTFGGEVYRQVSGGPIGARLTMAVARVVMQ